MNHLTSDADGPARSISRRRFLGGTAIAVAAGFFATNRRLWAGGDTVPVPAPAIPANSPRRYRVGVCDWMILKRQKLGAFQLTHDIGADGVEVDMGGLGDRETFDSKLGDAAVRRQFLDASRALNIDICSLAMSGFYAQAFAERPGVERMIQDCIDTMVAMGVRIAFLPLGVRGDLVKHPELRPAIVERLKAVGARAEKAGVVIGIETALDAAGEVKLLEDIGSSAVRSYFNFANALQSGRDLCAELRVLGRDRICQIHCTDQDGVWLQDDPKIDLPKVKRTLDEMGWGGWLVIERSRNAKDSKNVRGNFGANTRYLKSIFQAE
jgi:sugar phosphate isomerase/epimerase